MLNMNTEMNKVILFFTIKHNGNWEKIYNSIKTKQPITLVEINDVAGKYNDEYIAIIDNDYPENFKSIYMPPLSLFISGNKQLLFQNDNITSVWSNNNYLDILNNKLDKQKVYALFYKEDEIENINLLLNANYKIILVENSNQEKINIDHFKQRDNLLCMSEIPYEVKKPDLDIDQTNERLLLGVSKNLISFDFNDYIEEKVIPLCDFEKRKIQIINKVNKDILEKYECIEQFPIAKPN
ncbi:MAG: hypothetical protein ACRC4M_00635 [Mycoplasma sp.]